MKKDPEKSSVRDRVTRNRDVCFVLYTHINLTVEQFRHHAELELRDLRLSEKGRWSIMDIVMPQPSLIGPEPPLCSLPTDRLTASNQWDDLGVVTPPRSITSAIFPPHHSLPVDSKFWNILQAADDMERTYPTNSECHAEKWAERYFQEEFPKTCGEPAPPIWITDARKVLLALKKIRSAARMELRTISSRLRKSWEHGERGGLLEAIRGGLIQEPWVSKAIFDQQQRWRTGTAKEKREAKDVLELVGRAIKGPGSGNTEKLSLEEKETVEADFIHWCSLLKKLNKPLKRAWDDPAWEQASEEQRQAIRERLGKEFSLSLKEVNTAERYFKGSARCGLATPTEAAAELVGEKHGLGAGTVEKNHQDFLKRHPERRKKKRKSPTTPVAERTA